MIANHLTPRADRGIFGLKNARNRANSAQQLKNQKLLKNSRPNLK